VRGAPLEHDSALVAAFKRGDQAALATVFRTYADDVARQARASRLPEHDVEALTHDVFVKAFAPAARARWDGTRPFGAWLNTLTRNALVDRARKERRLELRAPDDMPDVATEAQSAADDHDARELNDVLQAVVGGCDELERAVFRARFEEGLSFPQAAKALGLSEIRVRTIDTRLRARLLEQARGAGFFARVRVTIGQSLLGRRQRRASLGLAAEARRGRTSP
jgi:RNA polymerase sigma-70 factor (ECF subfamily)